MGFVSSSEGDYTGSVFIPSINVGDGSLLSTDRIYVRQGAVLNVKVDLVWEDLPAVGITYPSFISYNWMKYQNTNIGVISSSIGETGVTLQLGYVATEPPYDLYQIMVYNSAGFKGYSYGSAKIQIHQVMPFGPQK